MTASAISTYSVLEHLSNSHQLRQRSINILFLGFTPPEIDPLLSLIRTGHMAPRGRRIRNEQELEQSLRERSWDLLLCSTHQPGDLSPRQAVKYLRQLNRDLPVIELSADTSEAAQLAAFQGNINALLPEQPGELLLYVIQRELSALLIRRQLRHTEAVLEVTEHHYHQQIESSRTAICYIHEGELVFCNASLLEQLGYEADALLGSSFDNLLQPEHRLQVHEQLQGLHDQHLPVDLSLELGIVRGDNSRALAQIQMQTCRYRHRECLMMSIRPEHELSALSPSSDVDTLTGLKNQNYLILKLDEATQRALAGGHDAHLLYLHLNQYASIRARVGREAAEQLVFDVTKRLADAVTAPHLLCRLEDDSLAILYRDADTEKALKLGRKLYRHISEIKPNGDASLASTCAVGVVTLNDNAPPASELLTRARAAADSLSNGNGCALYQATGSADQQQDEDAIKRILSAIGERRLKLMYQPVVPLDHADSTNNYEVLVRLLDEHDAILQPNRFMTAVEQSDVMVKLDRWVLERALQQAHGELAKGHHNRLFVNIAGRTLRSRSLLTWFGSQLEELGLPPSLIVFQISETDAASELEHARRFAQAVRSLHCGLCLKHFGSSPNAHIVFDSIDADYIKLDGAWVQDLQSGDMTDGALKRLLEPALAKKKVLIGPLVETTRVIGKLYRCGVQMIQGYYLQPPRELMDYDFFENK